MPVSLAVSEKSSPSEPIFLASGDCNGCAGSCGGVAAGGGGDGGDDDDVVVSSTVDILSFDKVKVFDLN